MPHPLIFRKFRTWEIILAFIMWTGVSSPGSIAGAYAQGCSAACDPDFGCKGSCSAVPPPGCGAICSTTGCTAKCQLVGRGEECKVVNVVECKPIAPKSAEPVTLADLKESNWAIVEVGWSLDRAVPTTVATSSPSFADEGVKRLLAETSTSFKVSPPEESTWFFVSPAAPCVEFMAELKGLDAGALNLAQSKIYITGETDGKGHLTSLSVLYSTHPGLVSEWVNFLINKLIIKSESVFGSPLRFFGFFTADAAGRVGFVVSGATVVRR